MAMKGVKIMFIIVTICLTYLVCSCYGKEPIPIPTKGEKYFKPLDQHDKRTLHFSETLLVPKKMGKVEMSLPRTAHETGFRGNFTTNAEFRADVSVDGRMTASFGYFNFPEINYVIEGGSHTLTLWFKDMKEITKYHKENPNASPETHDDYPVIYAEMILTTDEDRVKVIQEDWESKNKKTSSFRSDEL